MTTNYAPPTCPVCGKVFQGVQGLGGHLKVSKDAAHVEHRQVGKRPRTSPTQAVASASPAPASPASPHLAPAPSSPGPDVGRPPGMSDFDWGVKKTGEMLGDWMNRRREQRRVAAQAAPPPLPPPPRPQRAAPPPTASPAEDPGEAHWRSLLGNAYRPPNQRRFD